MLDRDAYLRDIDREGYAIVERVIPDEFVQRAGRELEIAIELESKYHQGDRRADFGMVLLCPLYGRVFIDVFDLPVVADGFNWVLGEGCIVYAYTSSSMPPGAGNYSVRVHVDCPRLIPGYRTNMAAMLLLDDFTERNGGTWFAPGTHLRADAPSNDEFFRSARRLVAPAGSVFFFDPRLWHSGGLNETDRWRHALTINMCRPWMKQRLDIPRAMAGMDLNGVSQQALQKLGFLAQTPASYDEYYAPPDKRTFRQRAE